ncbi:MAG: hypothetical protein MZW92_71660 [Comamonadaceae bacterium]|nr:hypothetical protein [Comamonadaceae bacterium]
MLVSVAHFLSHLFQLALPPLFPLLRAEFGTSRMRCWARMVGVLLRRRAAITQFAAGFVVDRRRRAAGARRRHRAARRRLRSLAASVPGVAWLFPVVALMGVGNGVFHPADFAILNANVAARRLGYAYAPARHRRQPRATRWRRW